jgi:hypothetical protein
MNPGASRFSLTRANCFPAPNPPMSALSELAFDHRVLSSPLCRPPSPLGETLAKPDLLGFPLYSCMAGGRRRQGTIDLD